MTETGQKTQINPDLAAEVHVLRQELARLNDHRFLRFQNSLWRLGLYQFYRGLAFGLGSVVGATLLVALLINMLSSIDFIPVIGDWAQRVIDQLNANSQP
ncbi:DUF5665 domain-containing protein [Aliiroseovarius subalbicans]|uniref:DUF5665 domain-containing protein n=1 Tax=Aliiroseovarius subalbicans TaxID=2925840 RepID=UPI001F5A9E01|nr:DUF5665 domain-containing protein [Aliiroseovarius subalbicans]MCI2399852.1 DUF5665 domain-containing protein [Aliiroseovarius subalbicans]